MHPLRETIKIRGGERERERGMEGQEGRRSWWPPRAHLQFVIRHTRRSRHRSSVCFPFRNIFIFYSSSILSLLLPSSLFRPPLFFDHSVLPLSSLSFFLPRSYFYSSSSSFSFSFVLDSRAFEARAENFEKENRSGGGRRAHGTAHRHVEPPFCVHYGHLQPGRKGPVYARTCERKAFRKCAARGRGERRHAAKAKICARSRYVLASIVQNFDGRGREWSITNDRERVGRVSEIEFYFPLVRDINYTRLLIKTFHFNGSF